MRHSTKSFSKKPTRYRQSLARLAAQLIVERGFNDYHQAKAKALEILCLGKKKNLMPSNQEVYDALKDYQSLYLGEKQISLIRQKQLVADKFMRHLLPFEPHLTGGVLDGTATCQSPIEVHVFSLTHDDVYIHLIDRKFKVQTKNSRYAFDGHHSIHIPCYEINFLDETFRIISFVEKFRPPLCPILRKPMQRLAHKDLNAMLE